MLYQTENQLSHSQTKCAAFSPLRLRMRIVRLSFSIDCVIDLQRTSVRESVIIEVASFERSCACTDMIEPR